ncbi:unnamed protein product [Darwinula stevensoni]|uniref:Glycosyltransferase family 92 protein n=1 Tax=Darwinula stevensoni TaxID=69355 RepID=A0A7R8XCW6_9CRUS|nr:unnamed protein product [Darwinula stevensoni]CAG0894088.1 unnamed protein product [Darwinula stevensoni]
MTRSYESHWVGFPPPTRRETRVKADRCSAGPQLAVPLWRARHDLARASSGPPRSRSCFQRPATISLVLPAGGFLEYIPITLPGTLLSIPGFEGPFLTRNELFRRGFYHLQFNDCVFRSLVQGYRYVAVMDTDEMIAPNTSYKTWPEMMRHLAPEIPRYDCYYFQTRIILMEEGETTGWLQAQDAKLRHVNAAEFPKSASRMGKSICVTATQVVMINHIARTCYPGDRPCSVQYVPLEFGELYHYGKCWVGNCTGSGGNDTCDGQSCEVVRKTSLLVHEDAVRRDVRHALQELLLLP